jgi:hypothetical protein
MIKLNSTVKILADGTTGWIVSDTAQENLRVTISRGHRFSREDAYYVLLESGEIRLYLESAFEVDETAVEPGDPEMGRLSRAHDEILNSNND